MGHYVPVLPIASLVPAHDTHTKRLLVTKLAMKYMTVTLNFDKDVNLLPVAAT